MTRLTLRAAALFAGVVAAAAGCADGARTPTAAKSAAEFHLLRRPPGTFGPSLSRSGGASVTATVGPEGGSLALDDGSRIDFPAGALAKPTKIEMSPSDEYAGVELEPHGIRFPFGREPVLTLAYPQEQGSLFSHLAIVYVSDGGFILEVLPTLPTADGHMSARLRHFSLYAGAGN
ncbi:MAG: hypothetical protein JWM27_1490 [Gemmatimonadetes bacterium]|nr:hypothetical protein [Gemmatimonadota bacterium]